MAPFFGYHMHSFSFPGVAPDRLFDRVVELAQAAEAADFDLVTVMDHFYQIGGNGPETEPMLEAYTALAGIAARTSRVRLGTLVTGVTYRNPAVLAKIVSTLDVVSRGRAILGIGAAWNESEHIGYGIEFPPIGRRMDMLEEALTIAKLMFTEDRPSFAGKFYRIERALNSPRPIQAGGPPILIGGMGEKRTLKLAARFADMTHWFGGSIENLKRLNGVLEGHCEAEGRDPATIFRTIGAPVLLVRNEKEGKELAERVPAEVQARTGQPATPDQAAGRIRPYMDAGFTGFTFGNSSLATPELIAAAGELKKLLS
jgi:F420-dependent oxidoreductase-like protein